MTLTSPIPATTNIPEFITNWYERLQPRTLAEVIADPASAAIFSTDMTVDDCANEAIPPWSCRRAERASRGSV